ncbi:alpha/beta hydrolase [Sinomonas terrae]|uniref:Alpha/beta hydrolase n=1 Tax=Sinomonas terrae TaxID=2908838 RepID=A0ABS9U4X3_9MICC|nr:alpha/beta hydrolase [Sinomonas terrae]MCH6471626.1 alpha/beta hydrolase [Sinomonas terrae]
MSTPAPSQGSPLRAVLAIIAGLAVIALALSACTPFGPSQNAKPGVDPSATAGAPPELAKYYQQQIQWSSCENGLECAKVTVPVDYSKPDGDTIQLAVARLQGKNTSASLLVNPGGPGASGIDLVRDSATQMFTQKLRDAYNIIGWDPRGVKRSAPVTCLNASQEDAARQMNIDPSTPPGLDQAFAEQKTVIEACKANTGPILAHTDTISSARDMDIIRAVVAGQTKLNYFGFSYGTFLGATYATLFSDRVGRFALDGALDPALTASQITIGQAKGFEDALHAYIRSCLSGSGCPVHGTEDEAVAQVRNLLQSVAKHPMSTTDGRILPITDFVNGMIIPLYNNQNWSVLTGALTSAFRGDGSAMLRLSDLAADRESDGTYSSNSNFAFMAYNCLDYSEPSDPAGMAAEAAQLEQASPTFGQFFAYGGVNCRDWPYQPVRTPAPAHYTGSSPIVVVGTTGDPATPYPWAQSLRSELGNADLLTWNGQGHTAYGRGSTCIDDAVDGYLVDGNAPKDGARC